jgi:hypothetical protein
VLPDQDKVRAGAIPSGGNGHRHRSPRNRLGRDAAGKPEARAVSSDHRARVLDGVAAAVGIGYAAYLTLAPTDLHHP